MRAFIVTLAALSVAMCAQARTLQGNPDHCGYLAKGALMLIHIQSFDKRSWDQVKGEIRGSIVSSFNNPDAYIKDAEDVELAMKVFERVWTDKDSLANRYKLMEEAYDMCMKPAGRTGRSA